MKREFEYPINDNNVMNHLVSNSSKADKFRYMISVLVIALSVSLIMSFAMLASGQRRVEMAMQEGRAQITVFGMTVQQYDTIKQQAEVSWVGIRTPITNTTQGNIQLKTYYIDETQLKKEDRESQLKGSLATGNQQVVVQQEMLDALKKENIKVGDTIFLNLDGLGGKGYQISGILTNNRTGNGTIRIMPNYYQVYISKDYAQNLIGESLKLYCDVRLNTDSISQSEVIRMAKNVLAKVNLSTDNIILSNNYFTVLGRLSDANDMTWLYAALLALFFALLSGGVIYSIFYISVTGKVRAYGQLRTLGMTIKQVQKIVRKEGTQLALQGIPLGWIIGGLLGYFLIPMGFRAGDTLLWAFLSGIFVFIAVHISMRKPAKIASQVSPIEGFRYSAYTGKQKATRKIQRPLVPGNLAIMNLGRNKKTTILTVSMMSFGAILILGIASVGISISGLAYAKYWYFPNSQFQLTINETIPTVLDDTATAEDTNLYMLKNSVIQQKNNPLNEQLISTIRSMDGVENVTTVSGFSSFIQTSTGSGGSMSNNSVNYTLTKDQFDMIKAAIIIGKADWQIFSKDNGVLIADTLINTPFNPLHYSVGDKIKTTMLAKDEKVIEIERPVMGVFSADKLMQMKVLPNSPQFLMARDAAQNIMGLRNDTVNLEVKVDSSKEKEVQSNLQNLVSLNRNIRLQSLSDTAKEQQAKYDSAVKLLTSLAVILFIFSLINFINTSFTNIRTRRREFGLLQSVGMTQQQIRKMLQTENSFYVIASTISAVVGVVIGAAFCKYLDASQHCILYQLPIRILMLFVACLIILHILMGFFASLNLKRESIIDRISISE